MANPRVVVAEVFPSQADTLDRAPAVKLFESPPQLARALGLAGCRLAKRRLWLAADVTHAVQPGLGAAAAGHEIHRAVRPEVHPGDIERPAGDELLRLATVARPLRHEVNGNYFAVSPVENEQRAAVRLGKVAVGAKRHRRRRAEADVGIARQAVGKVSRPFVGTLPPAVVAAGDNVIDARRPVPRRALVPLHVSVVNEQLAVRIEGQAVGIAEAAGDHVPAFAVLVRADDMPRRRLDALVEHHAVPFARQQLVASVVAIGGCRCRLKTLPQQDVVAVREVDETVRAESDGVAAVPDSAAGFAQERHLVELIVAGCVAKPVKALRVVGVGVQAAVRPEKPAALVQLVVDDLDMGAAKPPPGQRQPQDARPLAADQQPALAVKLQADPRPLRLRRRAEQIHLKAGDCRDMPRGGRPTCLDRLLPLVVVHTAWP